MTDDEKTAADRETEIRRECGELAETLAAKNQDYGNSAEQAPLFARGLSAETALLIRLGDKVRRLDALLAKETLTGAGPAIANESIDDTLLDLAGYAILIRMARRRKKDRP